MKYLHHVGALLLAGCFVGCTPSTGTFDNYSRIFAGKGEWEKAFGAAQDTMQEYFRLEETDRQRGVIRSLPVLGQAKDSTALALSSPRRIRRIAEMRLEPQSDGSVLASCCVKIQENSTAEHRVFAQHNSLNDAPNRTPLEESEGFDKETRGGVWTTTGSDKMLEREVLAAFMERVSKQ